MKLPFKEIYAFDSCCKFGMTIKKKLTSLRLASRLSRANETRAASLRSAPGVEKPSANSRFARLEKKYDMIKPNDMMKVSL